MTGTIIVYLHCVIGTGSINLLETASNTGTRTDTRLAQYTYTCFGIKATHTITGPIATAYHGTNTIAARTATNYCFTICVVTYYTGRAYRTGYTPNSVTGCRCKHTRA